MIPTVGFNMRKVSKGNVTIKVSYPSVYLRSKINICLPLNIDRQQNKSINVLTLFTEY